MPFMASVRLFSVILAFGGSAAEALDHGPLVQWSANPESTAHLRWLERGETKGIEGRWAAGPGGFGYSDGDDRTVFAGMQGKYRSVAIRRELALPAEVPGDATLYLAANYDDGFVAWLDGREIARRNVEGEDFRIPRDHEAGRVEEILLGRTGQVLPGGKAILAVRGFNVSATSSDFTLDIRVVAKKDGKTLPVVAEGEIWEYLAGKEPEEGWKKTLAKVEPVKEDDSKRPEIVEFRAKSAPDWRRAEIVRSRFSASNHRVCAVTLEGLPAGEEIEFRVGGQGKSYRFLTAPRDARRLRFVTGGDLYHHRAPMDAMNRRAGLEDPLFALLGGDLAYTNDVNPERWFAFMDSWVENARTPNGRLLPMVVAIGNHEVKDAGYRPLDAPGPGAAREFFGLFHMQETGEARQVVDFGRDLSLVLLDSGHAATVASQNKWLERVLQERRDIPRVFACYHRPAWGCGAKGDAVEIQRDWCPIFERFNIDGVFENDHHVHSRSHPIRGGKVDEKRGIPYLGAGAWSVGVREIPGDAFEKRPWLARAESLNHIYVVDLSEQGWTAEAKTVDGKAFDRVERPWRR